MPNPIEQQFDNIGLLFNRQRAAFRNMMPFFEAPAATAGAGVLRREDRVTLHRRLFAVVGNIRWGKPCRNESGGVRPEDFFAFFEGVPPVGRRQVKLRAELRERKAPQLFVAPGIIGKNNGNGVNHD